MIIRQSCDNLRLRVFQSVNLNAFTIDTLTIKGVTYGWLKTGKLWDHMRFKVLARHAAHWDLLIKLAKQIIEIQTLNHTRRRLLKTGIVIALKLARKNLQANCNRSWSKLPENVPVTNKKGEVKLMLSCQLPSHILKRKLNSCSCHVLLWESVIGCQILLTWMISCVHTQNEVYLYIGHRRYPPQLTTTSAAMNCCGRYCSPYWPQTVSARDKLNIPGRLRDVSLHIKSYVGLPFIQQFLPSCFVQ